MPKVSVVMSSYNHARFIAQAIRSVLDQSFDDFEFIIFENGSTDNSLEIIKSFSDPRIIFHTTKTNQGSSGGMNQAIECANGDYLALLNSDDYFLPGKLERQVKELDANESIGAAFSLPLIVDERGSPHPDPGHIDFFKDRHLDRFSYLHYFFFHGNCLAHPTAIIRRSAFDQIGSYDTRLRRVPDLDYWIRLVARYDIMLIDEELTAIRFLDDKSNESGPRPEVWAASRWEASHVMRHYLNLDNTTFAKVFRNEITSLHLDGLDRRVQLGKIAVSAQDVSAHALGLDLLYEAITHKLPGITASEVQELSGVLDIFGLRVRHSLDLATQNLSRVSNDLEATRGELQAIKNSKSWRMTEWARNLLRVANSWRSPKNGGD
ncbi:MAG: glycosyltransferase [Proteobacteria bacterium]|nr:glycosyltransferase [Pseudomonadota bacterium]